jgi:hypothetical protein
LVILAAFVDVADKARVRGGHQRLPNWQMP